MTKQEMLTRIHTEREAFEAAWEGLAPERMTAGGVMGEWSVKDILGHVAMWESRLVTILYSNERGVPPKMLHGQVEVDKINAESYAEQRERPLDRVLADFHAVHAQLLKRLDKLADRDLSDPKRFKWMEGEPLEKLVAGDTFEHYAEHRSMIQAWQNRSA